MHRVSWILAPVIIACAAACGGAGHGSAPACDGYVHFRGRYLRARYDGGGDCIDEAVQSPFVIYGAGGQVVSRGQTEIDVGRSECLPEGNYELEIHGVREPAPWVDADDGEALSGSPPEFPLFIGTGVCESELL